ncbi:glycine cleavage system aminomethyltransferase GcvT [Thermoanaerobacterium sp. R66]|uniref:glycine cleavage system aminomethyltransferase GcvT n=1 Tax=Thermoanaerobacterium sp. R66 TaxID=2742479 RepID=UPI0023803FD3|nr:glycine cleavage system aminomethyltransferase GcvT [Thermoanaerobacterium sp. R66]MDE4542201.1 glycine cleavage system aminomethyltransferase GcvT [Thermoanaerobacterium sp. R66]
MDSLKRTPLYDIHKKYGAKMIDFAGFEMPVQYESILKEHEAVRKNAGLFDVSHMGEIIVEGRDSEKFINYMVTNDITKIGANQAMYSPMCYSNGTTVDDLLVYKFSYEKYMLVVNASNIDKDYKWLWENKNDFAVEIKDESGEISELALQGPKSQEILEKITNYDLDSLKYYHFDYMDLDGINCLVSRSGYTGEDGFEIFLKNEYVALMWEKILSVGENLGIKPAGLGARDTLRFEAGLPLYGNELSDDITPLEAGLGSFVKLDKSFLGKEALLNQKEEGLKRKIVGFEMADNAIPRHGYDVYAEGEKIGYVTTGYLSPTLKKNIGMALINSQFATIGNEINIIIRNKPYKAFVASKNFYKKNYKK